MLGSFERIMVEHIRRHKGKITLKLDDEGETEISPSIADDRFNKDIALALQSYYNRHQNNK